VSLVLRRAQAALAVLFLLAGGAPGRAEDGGAKRLLRSGLDAVLRELRRDDEARRLEGRMRALGEGAPAGQ